MRINHSARNYAKGLGLDLDNLSSSQREKLGEMTGSDAITTNDLREAMARMERGEASWLKKALDDSARGPELPRDKGEVLRQIFKATHSDVAAVRHQATKRLDTLLTSPATRTRTIDQLVWSVHSDKMDNPLGAMRKLEELGRFGVLGEVNGKIALYSPEKKKWDPPDFDGSQSLLLGHSMSLLSSGDLSQSDKEMLAGAMLSGSVPSTTVHRLQSGGEPLLGDADPEIFEKIQQTAFNRGISLQPLHNTIEGTPLERGVSRAGEPLVVDETRLALIRFENNYSDSLKSTLGDEVKRYAGNDSLDQSKINDAIKDGTIGQFADRLDTGSEKLTLLFKLKGLAKKADEFGKKSGFDLDTSRLDNLKTEIAKLGADPDVQQTMQYVRREAIADALGIEKMQADDYARRLENYLGSQDFATRLEGKSSAEQRELIAEHMKILGALSPESAQTALRTMIGRQFMSRRMNILSQTPLAKRENAVKAALEQVLGAGEKVGGAAKSISAALAEIEGDPDASSFDKKLRDAIKGTDDNPRRIRAALDKVDQLRARGALGTVLTIATLRSVDLPDNVMEGLAQTKNVTDFITGSQDIAKLMGSVDKLSKGADLLRTLKPLSEVLGPVGDVLDATINTVDAVEAGQDGDWGDMTGKSVAAGGAAGGLLLSAGAAITGSTGWTGVGLLVGLGSMALGGIISTVFGESDAESNLENSGLIEDTDVDYVPFV